MSFKGQRRIRAEYEVKLNGGITKWGASYNQRASMERDKFAPKKRDESAEDDSRPFALRKAVSVKKEISGRETLSFQGRESKALNSPHKERATF